VGETIKMENIVPGDIIDGHLVNEVKMWPNSNIIRLVLDGGSLIIHGEKDIMLNGVKKIKENMRGGK